MKMFESEKTTIEMNTEVLDRLIEEGFARNRSDVISQALMLVMIANKYSDKDGNVFVANGKKDSGEVVEIHAFKYREKYGIR